MKTYTYLLFLLLLGSCKHGVITEDIGQSEKFLDLRDSINENIISKIDFVDGFSDNSSQLSVRVEKIISIEKPAFDRASIKIEESNQNYFYGKTEIVTMLIVIRDIYGNLYDSYTIKSIFCTNEEYYSESEFPLNDFLSFTERRSETEDSFVSTVLTIGESSFRYSERFAEFETEGSTLSYSFDNKPFVFFQTPFFPSFQIFQLSGLVYSSRYSTN
ncbi:MAG: hypothetical protein RIC57_05780 [Balneola sp.]